MALSVGNLTQKSADFNLNTKSAMQNQRSKVAHKVAMLTKEWSENQKSIPSKYACEKEANTHARYPMIVVD